MVDAPGGAPGATAGTAPGATPAAAPGATPGTTPGAAPPIDFGGWLKGTPAEFQGLAQSKAWSSFDHVIDHTMNAQKLIGGDKVALPPKDADGNRDWSKWEGWSHMGIPDKPDGYKINLPDGYQATDVDKAFHAALLPALHGSKLAQWQVDNITKSIGEFGRNAEAQQLEAANREGEAAEQALRKEFPGEAYAAFIDLTERTILQYGGAELKAKVVKAGLARDPAFLKAWHAVGKEMSEHGAPPDGKNAGDFGGITPEGATARKNQLMNDKEWVKRYQAGGQAERQEMEKLNRALAAAQGRAA